MEQLFSDPLLNGNGSSSTMRTHMHQQPRRTASAFTLVELLIVIAIIAILIGLLMSATTKARDIALLRICQSNLHQVHIASGCYANDNRGYLPDIVTLGGYYFRRAPGTLTPYEEDPYALPERYGLAAVLDRGGYMPGNNEAWVCQAHPQWMKEFGNTYMFATGNIFRTTQMDYLGRTAWVWDNYLAMPYTSGFYGSPGPGWLIPANRRKPPHRPGASLTSDKDGSNYVYADGTVVFQHEKPD